MKSINTNIPYVSIKKNIKYPINGRQHTYEDIYNMYQSVGIEKTIPYHTIKDGVKEYTTDTNSIVNTSSYTDIKELTTSKHKLVYNTSVYKHDSTNNIDNETNVQDTYFYNNIDNNLPNNVYNSEIYYDISTFIYIPNGIITINTDTINNKPALLGESTCFKPVSLSTNHHITINSSIPDEIYNNLLRRNSDDVDKLSYNDIFIISRSNIKYPEFKVDIDELEFVSKNIDWYSKLIPQDIYNIGFTAPNSANGIKNTAVQNIIKDKEQTELYNNTSYKNELYNILYNNQYYTIIKLTYNNQLYDRIRQYKINIHVPNNNYNIPIEFIKLSNVLFVSWRFSYIVTFENDVYDVIPYGGHTKVIRNNGYINKILPPITPITMGILPQARANGAYPTNAYHYIYGDTVTNTNRHNTSSFNEIIQNAIVNSKNRPIENNCRYNNGINMPWQVTSYSRNSKTVEFQFKSILYEFPAEYRNIGNGTLNGIYGNDYIEKDGNKIYQDDTQYEHNIMFFMSFARFFKDKTGQQIFQDDFSVSDIPVQLDINISTKDEYINQSICDNNKNFNMYKVQTNITYNSVGIPNMGSLAGQTSNIKHLRRDEDQVINISLEFPGQKDPKYGNTVKRSFMPIPASDDVIGIPTLPYSVNITGIYGSARDGLENDLYANDQAYNSDSAHGSRPNSYFKQEPNATAIIPRDIILGYNDIDVTFNDIYTNPKPLPWLTSSSIMAYTPSIGALWNSGKELYTYYVNTLSKDMKYYYYNSNTVKLWMPKYFMHGYGSSDFINEIKKYNYKYVPNTHVFTFNSTLYELANPSINWLLSMFPVN